MGPERKSLRRTLHESALRMALLEGIGVVFGERSGACYHVIFTDFRFFKSLTNENQSQRRQVDAIR